MTDSSLRSRLDAMLAASPYIVHSGMTITAVDVEQRTLTMRMPYRPELEGENGTGVWHGGPIAALADTAGCFAAIMLDGRNAGTIGLSVDYLRAASGGYLDATARIRKPGRTYSTVDVDVTDSEGKLVAVGRGTFYFMRG